MLEYCKKILYKVSFDPVLFEKEFEKALRFVHDHERHELLHWCQIHFGRRYCEIISPYINGESLRTHSEIMSKQQG